MTCITTIEEQVAKVICHSQFLPKAEPKALIDKWHNAKKAFIDAWGDYIYEVPEPIVFYLSTEEKRHRFNEFIDAVDNTYDNRCLTDFLDWLTIDEVFDNDIIPNENENYLCGAWLFFHNALNSIIYVYLAVYTI